jgi:hypothetical protein
MKHLFILTLSSILIGLTVKSYVPPMFQALAVTTEPQKIAGGSATLKEIPSQTMEEAIGKAKYWDIIMRLWTLERSQGRSPSQVCLAQGKTNELGYGINDNSHYCYDSYDQIVGVVDDWLTRKLAVYSLPQTLCLYQSGEPLDDCGYYRKYKLLD